MPPSQPTPSLRPFHLACWVLGVLAFAELMFVGVAVASRSQTPEPQIIERIVEVPVPVEMPVQKTNAGPRSLDEILDDTPDVELSPERPVIPDKTSAGPEYANLYDEGNAGVPAIADPFVERLVTEASRLFVGGDAVRAVLKYHEVLARDPEQLHALYGLAQVYEQMGRNDLASDHYALVYERGTDAGVYYRRAARKLAEGFTTDAAMVGKMRIGQVRKNQVGQKVALIIPIISAAGVEVVPDEVGIKARIYVKDTQGEIRLLRDSDRSQRSNKWLSDEQDWLTQEEVLTATFVRAAAPDEPEFYGYVISLSYGNTVLDLVAWPRMLATRVQTQSPPPIEVPNFDDLPEDFFDDVNFENPILPVKP